MNSHSCFLNALAGKNSGRPPVWLMRQAGRYMKSYQKLRKKYSFEELALIPELAAEVTLLPIQQFDFDAAILFSDILFPLKILGVKVEFPESAPPKIIKQTPFLFSSDIRACLEEHLSSVYQAIRLLKGRLDKPLIGFAGAPWTLFSYLELEIRSQGFEKLFKYLEEIAATHLLLQKEAGCDVVQIFDSHAHQIPQGFEEQLSLGPVKRIVEKLSCPAIFYKVQKSTLSFFEHRTPCALSLDGTISPEEARKSLSYPYTLQGNIDPNLLTGDKKPLEHAVNSLLHSMHADKRFIVNVSHGLLPLTKESLVKYLVDLVKGN
jgi:uroporphyrinogen decarboxylase